MSLPFLNMALLSSPQNWARVWLMLSLVFVGLFLLVHFFAPNSVGATGETS